MIPCAADRVAGNSGRHPLVIYVVVDVPLVPASNPALMSPNVGLSAHELVDVELHGLRHAGISHPEVNVIGEIMQARNDGVIGVLQPLGRHAANQMDVPECV